MQALLEDAQRVSSGIHDNSWVDGTLGAVGGSLDALGMAIDPLGTLAAWGVGWLIEHVRPLQEALDWLAGKPDEIAAQAGTWQGVAESIGVAREQYTSAVAAETAGWFGAAAGAYREHAADQLTALDSLATVTRAISYAVEGAGLLVGLVRDIVRDLIAQFIATLAVRLPQWLAAEGLTLGIATPVVAAQVTGLVSRWANRIQGFLRALVSSLRRLNDRLDELVGVLGRLSRTARDTAVPAPQRPSPRIHGGHSTRPRNVYEFEQQYAWADNAYASIRADPDADVIANRLTGVSRLDGSTGFSRQEIEQIRQHIFFEEHPLSDYDGGVVQQRYDASPDMAEAWLRLRSGRHLPEDVALLEHELAESRHYRAHPGSTYEDAHAAANEVSNWQNQIPSPTYEDHAMPWR
ncbi:WXG100 family type VII secretion target [Actinoplanes sp. CA-015351]|uniref:WXG100 family type VII secretion target n=1 Tax=Actinoplanes sp. CA-015351 TaxID=3239897 RepID=UPI003D978D17